MTNKILILKEIQQKKEIIVLKKKSIIKQRHFRKKGI